MLNLQWWRLMSRKFTLDTALVVNVHKNCVFVCYNGWPLLLTFWFYINYPLKFDSLQPSIPKKSSNWRKDRGILCLASFYGLLEVVDRLFEDANLPLQILDFNIASPAPSIQVVQGALHRPFRWLAPSHKQPLIPKILQLDLMNQNVFDFGFDFSLSMKMKLLPNQPPHCTLALLQNVREPPTQNNEVVGAVMPRLSRTKATTQIWWFYRHISTQCNK